VIDNVLDRFSLCDDVTPVVRLENSVLRDRFKELAERYFPLMWENGKVVPEVEMEDGFPRWI